MPQSVSLAAFIFGAVLVLIAVLGGRFKIFGAEVTGTVSGPLRVVAGTVGVPLLAVGMFLTFSAQDTPAADPNAGSATKREVPPTDVPGFKVSYEADEYGADVTMGNTSDDIIIVTEPTFHWTYQECPKLIPPRAGAMMQEYRYTVKLSKTDDSKLLDSRAFKYSSGEADDFIIDLKFPGNGVYTTWFSVQYKHLGNSREQTYNTKQAQMRLCYRY
jgi:hypothetical protein